MRGYRRQYIENRSPEKAVAKESSPNPSLEALQSAAIDLKAANNQKELFQSIEELQKSIKAVEEKIDSKIDSIETRLRKAETDVQKAGRLCEVDLLCIKNELEAIKKERRAPSYQPSCEYVERPVMPGSGFACITPGYLRNMQQNR